MGFFSTDYIPRSSLPPRVITGNTIKPDERKRTHCNKCGAPYVEGKNFCVECGEKRQVSSSINMGDKNVKAKELAEYLTGWLAENPYLYDVKIDANMHCIQNDFNRVGSVRANNVVLKFSIADKPYSRTYGVAYVYTYKCTINYKKIMNISAESLVETWKQYNPDLRAESWTGGRVTCTDNGTYQLYALIVYSKETVSTVQMQNSQPIAQPQPQAQPEAQAENRPPVQFCRHCGHKLTKAGNFCVACGGKL